MGADKIGRDDPSLLLRVFARICGWNKVSNVPSGPQKRSQADGLRPTIFLGSVSDGSRGRAVELPRLPVTAEGRRKAHRPFGRSRCPSRRPPTATLENRPPSAVAAGFPQALGKPPAPGGSRIGFPQSHSPDYDEPLSALSQPSDDGLRTRHRQAVTGRHSGVSSCLSAALESDGQKEPPASRA